MSINRGGEPPGGKKLREADMKTRTSFTLIELLVVVAIISVLFALLLPALGLAKGTARSIRCLANERQQGLAAFSYANDFNSWAPVLLDGANNWWSGILADNGYLPARPWTMASITFCDDLFNYGWKYYPGTDGGLCTFFWMKFTGTYGYNHHLIRDGSFTSKDTSFRWTSLKQPSAMVFLGEVFTLNVRCDTNGVNNYGGYIPLRYPHRNKVNILRCDGGAASMGCPLPNQGAWPSNTSPWWCQ